uniref:Uncharacterized protein n=1 Tax=Rhizophora mucronata TaxID=61149 RepID=A0A2P2J3E5_RHIMU
MLALYIHCLCICDKLAHANLTISNYPSIFI